MFGLLLAVPAVAAAIECPLGEIESNGTEAADWPLSGHTGHCVTFSEWLAEGEAARTAHEVQEKGEETARKQKEVVEEREKELEQKKETGEPPTNLHVTIISVHGSTYKNPGHTDIDVSTNRFAEVFLKFTYPQHQRWAPTYKHFKERLEGEEEDWESGESDGIIDPWSCQAPMLVERWEVRVRGESQGVVEPGPGLVAKGQFVNRVSAKWCKAAKKREQEANRRRAREEAARQRAAEQRQLEEVRHTAEREYAERKRFEENCRAIGGEPVGIQSSEGPETVCRKPGGGILPVPGV
jgi:hypothetical protein